MARRRLAGDAAALVALPRIPAPPLPQQVVAERLQSKPQVINTAYAIAEGADSQDIVPTLIHDNERFTHLQFPGNRELPAVFEVLGDGSEALVNAVSDWIEMPVAAQADLAVDIYLPGDTSATGTILTVRNGALQTNYVSTEGNHAGAPTLPVAATRTIWQFLAAIDVVRTPKTLAIVAFGDSITEGLRSTSNTNRRWPDVLAQRVLVAQPALPRSVVNVGISGNRVGQGGGSTNPSALSRFDRAVIAQTGARYVIVLLGINDISGGATADDVIANLRQVIIRARSHKLKIFGGTITPFGNQNDLRESYRLAVNAWIRSSREWDGVVDFDAALRDPANTRRMLPQYDSGDSLHPSDAGYEAMGNAVDLSQFAN